MDFRTRFWLGVGSILLASGLLVFHLITDVVWAGFCGPVVLSYIAGKSIQNIAEAKNAGKDKEV